MKKAIFFLCLSVLLFSNSAIAQTLPSYLPPNGLVGWWPFNGNANDESGNGNHGTVNGATLTADRNGNSNQSYYFNGSSLIQSYYSSSLNSIFENQAFTISMWYKIDAAYTGVFPFFAMYNPSNDFGWELLEHAGLGGVLYYNNSSGVGPFFDLSNLNEWENIVFSFDSSSNHCEFYINNQMIYSGLFNSSIPSTPNGMLTFGGSPNGPDEFNLGLLDDIAIYNRALTQEEITALYTGTPNNGGGGGSSSANPVPPGIPYQAVVRNANGQVAANAAVTTRFTLHQTTADGAVEYQETHALTTNAQGLMSTVLGQGTAVQNTFASINWANTTKFLQVEVDLGNGYVDLGTQQLMSVPYSIQSQTARTIRNTDLPVYADNAAALAGGLTTGQLYRTSTGDLKIVY